jgi:putative RecB family exonuclease
MSTYSFSQIWTFQTCPRKYQYQYIDKLGKESKEDSLTLTLWSVFHESLEFLYKQKSNTIDVSLDQLLLKYEELWIKYLADFMEAPVEADLQMFQSRGREYLCWYYDMYQPFNTRVMGIEDWVRFKLEDGIDFMGKLDRMDAAGDTIVITDYKTSRRLMPDDEDHNREQIVLYAHGIKQTYGRKFTHIQAALIYPHLQKEYRFTIDDEEIGEVVSKYLAIMRDIELRKSKHENLFADWVDQFPALAGNHCNYCPFRQICPKWKHEFINDEMLASDLGERTISAFVSDYLRISEQLKKLESEKKYLTELITQWMQAKDISKRETSDGGVGMVSRDYYSIKSDHKDDIKQYLSEYSLLDEVLDLDRNKFEKLIKDGTLDLEQIQDYIATKKTSWLMSKKPKEE